MLRVGCFALYRIHLFENLKGYLASASIIALAISFG